MRSCVVAKRALIVLGIAFIGEAGLAFAIGYLVGDNRDALNILGQLLTYIAIPIGIAGIPPTISVSRKVDLSQELTPYMAIAIVGLISVLLMLLIGPHNGAGAFYIGLLVQILVAVWTCVSWFTKQ